MLKVQEELSTLRERANERELQAKQERKIATLEKEVGRYRTDCEALMKYTSMQKQLIRDYTQRRKELRDDETYYQTEVAQSNVDKLRLKVALTETQYKCEALGVLNQSANQQLDHEFSISKAAQLMNQSNISKMVSLGLSNFENSTLNPATMAFEDRSTSKMVGKKDTLNQGST